MLRDIIYADDLCTHGTRPYEGAEAYIKLSTAVNILAAWMIQNGFSTGHGETIEGLLAELKYQIDQIRIARDNYRGSMEVLSQGYSRMKQELLGKELCLVCHQNPVDANYGDFCSRKCRAEHYD